MSSCAIFILIVYSTEPQDKKKNNEDNQKDTSQPQKLQSNMQATHRTQLHNSLNKMAEKNTTQLHNGIILSHFNQSSALFISPGQGLQCVANCIISIIYHKHKKCINWKLFDITNILYSGNVLYNSVGKFTTILVSDLPKHIKLYNTIYNIQEVNSVIGNIFINNQNFNTLSFDKVEPIIVKYKYMILILGSSALSIIYSHNFFYTFDPHKRNTYGLPNSSGGAAVLKFNSFNQLCLYIYELSHHLNTTDYELTPIIVRKYTHHNHAPNTTNHSTAKRELNNENFQNISTMNNKDKTSIFTKNRLLENDSEMNENMKCSSQIDERQPSTITITSNILHNNNSEKNKQKQLNNTKTCQKNDGRKENLVQMNLKRCTENDITENNNMVKTTNNTKIEKDNIETNGCNKLKMNTKQEHELENYNYLSTTQTRYEKKNSETTIQKNTNKRKIKNTNNTEEKNGNVKRTKLAYTTNIDTSNKNATKRKVNNSYLNTIPAKKMKHEKQDKHNDNYSNVQEFSDKLIPLSDMIILKNEEKKKTYKKIEQDYKLCYKYGYKFNKVCTIHITDITQTLAILNAKIKTQSKNKKEILLKKPSLKISNYSKTSKIQRIKKETSKKYLKLINKNKKCEKYGYKFNKILIIDVQKTIPTQPIQVNTIDTLTNNQKKQYGKTFAETIAIFNNLTSQGPIYVCSVCQQNNFKEKVHIISTLKQHKYINFLNQCKTNYISINNHEYICATCKEYITKGIVPKLSVKNGCGFPTKPIELDLFNLEERFISPVMAFMLIHQLFPGGQLSLYGSICHLPIEIGKMVDTLPRNLNQFETIAVKLKRRLCYKNTVFNENIRPQKIMQALKYLLQNSELYQQHNININTQWLSNFTNETNDTSTNNHTPPHDDQSNDKNQNTSDFSDDDTNNEDLPNAPSVNTLLTEKNIDPNKNILCIAPGEGQKPIFTDADTEYLCFPTIFCGERRKLNIYHKLSKREIFKYEMRCADKRVSTNIPNIFWKTKYKQIHQIHQQVSFALRRNQTKGKKITAKTLLDTETRQEIVKYDDGYKIFKNVRSSPPYFESKKKELMAMIQQLGIPTLFISLSAADTKWTELLQTIYISTRKTNISIQQLEQMSWHEKCDLISKDPGTCALFFNNRVKKFFKHILKSPHSPIGKLENFFYRVEFQHRGSPHIHALLWIKNAPHYEKDNDLTIIQYIDKIISCSTNDTHKKYIDLQIHKHSKTCIKKTKNNRKCRFGAPWPPLDKTQILYPLEKEQQKDKHIYSKIYTDINKFIQLKYKEKNYLDFYQMLSQLNINYEKYILALRSTINKKKVFL